MSLFGKPVKPLSGKEKCKLMKLLDYQDTRFPTHAFNVSLFDCVEEVDTKVLVNKTQIMLKLPIRGHLTTTIDALRGQTCIYYKDVIDHLIKYDLIPEMYYHKYLEGVHLSHGEEYYGLSFGS
jgi:hypothetical protein